MAVIYEIENLINGKKYIGVDTKNDPNYFGSGKLVRSAIKKYGKHNFKKQILCEFKDNESAFQYERELLSKLDACNSDMYYNIHEGGLGGKTWIGDFRPESHRQSISAATKGRIAHNKGVPRTDETKIKLSKSHTGKTLSDDHKKSISDSLKGRERSIEHCQKISESLKGKQFSDSHKENLSQSLKGREPWNKGKIGVYSDDQLQSLKNAKSGHNNPMYGKTHSNETKEKMKLAWQERKNKKTHNK